MKSVTLVFFHHSEEVLTEWEKQLRRSRWEGGPFNVDVEFRASDVLGVVQDPEINMLTCLTSCFGFLDGTTNRKLEDLYPGLQTRIQERIEHYQLEWDTNRPYLPIGSSILVPTGSTELCNLLALTPLTVLDSDISQTHNVYWAIRGVCKVLEEVLGRTEQSVHLRVAIPLPGIEIGKLDPDMSAQQVAFALTDHSLDNQAYAYGDVGDVRIWEDEHGRRPKFAYVLTGMACPQVSNDR